MTARPLVPPSKPTSASDEFRHLARPHVLSVTRELIQLLIGSTADVVDFSRGQRDVLGRAVDHARDAADGHGAHHNLDGVHDDGSRPIVYLVVDGRRAVGEVIARSGAYVTDDRVVNSAGHAWRVVSTETGDLPVLHVEPWPVVAHG